MKKYIKIVPLLFASILTLTGCNDEKEETTNFTLLEMYAALQGSLHSKEVSDSSKVLFNETYKKDDVSVEEDSETWNVYNKQIAGVEGSKKITYSSSNQVIEDSYKKIVKRITYTNADVIYFVTDYEHGNKRVDWVDSAALLPVVKTGTSDQDGVSYLLESSVLSQISKQVSLIGSNFIQSQFTSNVNVQSSFPQGYKSTLNGKERYYINPFSYSYEDDSITTAITVSFEYVVSNGKLLSFDSYYKQVESMDESDSYTIEDNIHYEISYDSRVEAPADLINPEDYFLQEVNEVEAYYVDEKGNQVITSIEELPTNTYVHFKAKDYSPSKAVDISLYPVEDQTLNTTIISLDGNTFHTERPGTTTVKVTTANGIEKELTIKVLPVPLKSITYNDTYSGIEIDTKIVGDETIKTRYVYSNTTYSKINITLTPSDADLNDIVATVDKENMVNITSTVNTTTVSFTYEVLDVKDGDTFTVTFSSRTNPDIKTEITYNCKKNMTLDEKNEYLKNHTYKYTSIWDKTFTATLTFDGTNGRIEYSTGDVTTFTYELNDTSMTISITSSDPVDDFNEVDIKLDLSSLTFWEGTSVKRDFVIQL